MAVAKRDRTKRPKGPSDTRCPHPKCGGVLWNVSSRLAQATGVLTLRCEGCKRGWAFRVGEQ